MLTKDLQVGSKVIYMNPKAEFPDSGKLIVTIIYKQEQIVSHSDIVLTKLNNGDPAIAIFGAEHDSLIRLI